MKKKATACLLTVFLLYACAPTRVSSEWKAPGYMARDFRKILVAGITHEPTRALRAAMEAHVANDMQANGYTAVSALARYGPGHFRPLSEEERLRVIKADSVDAVLTIVLLDKIKERHYVPGQVMRTPYGTYHNRLWGYYNTMTNRIETPGYYEESTHYFWESNLYDVATGQLVYSIQTESFDPASVDQQAHRYGLEIMRSMRANAVLPTRKRP